MFDKCPRCGALTLIWEGDMNRWACIRMDSCGYIKYLDDRIVKHVPYRDEGEDTEDD